MSSSPPPDGDAPRLSLLDVVAEEYQQEKHARTSRMVLLSTLDASSISILQKFHADHLDSVTGARVTGLIFALNGCVTLQLIEAPTHILLELLRNILFIQGTPLKQLQPFLSNPHLPVSSAHFIHVNGTVGSNYRILSFSEEVPREFNIWAFRSIRVPNDDFALKDPLKQVFETVKNLLELGRELASMSEEKAIDYIQTSTSRQLTSKLPSAERLLAYVNISELCSVDEFLDIYDRPVQFALEAEKVWPMEQTIKY